MGNNLGKWDQFYGEGLERGAYEDTQTYYDGAKWLADCSTVEDWGCGKGWFEKIAEPYKYEVVGIDGSDSPFAAKVADLEHYISDTEGIFMRHVLEHNFEWKKILYNVMESFTKRLFIVFFTPMTAKEEKLITMSAGGYDNIPDLSLPRDVIESIFEDYGCKWTTETIKSPTVYGEETSYWVSK